MPILGIIASSFRSAAGPQGAYDALATVTVPSGGVATVSFVGIPTGYKHLQIRYNAHSEGTANDYGMIKINFNSDTSANYAYHRLYGNGSSASSDATSSTSTLMAPWVPDDQTLTDAYGVGVIDILDYASTTKTKTVRTLGGFDMNGKGFAALFSGLWFKTPEAITRIDLTSNTAQDFDQYSSFALYGVK